MKKNVMFMTHSEKKGGAEQSLIHLINFMDTSKYNIFLLCPEGTEYLSEISVPIRIINLKLQTLKKDFGISYVTTIKKISDIIKANRINVVHANGWRAPWFALPFRFNRRIKTIWHHRDRFESFAYNLALPFFMDNIICISNYVKGTLHSIHHNKCKVIYNGIDNRQINNMIISSEYKTKHRNEFIIGAFGRITEWKRFDIIIKAFYLFFKKNPGIKCKLYIVGGTGVDGSDDYYQYLLELIKSYDIKDQVQLWGHVKNPLEIMKLCDLTINFSDREPFGRVVIESLLMRTPVIVADSGGAPEIINITKGGLVAKDNDENDLYLKILEIFGMDMDTYSELCENGYTNTLEYFNMPLLIKEIEQLYINKV
jgi:L-malate glycosyltransferase